MHLGSFLVLRFQRFRFFDLSLGKEGEHLQASQNLAAVVVLLRLGERLSVSEVGTVDCIHETYRAEVLGESKVMEIVLERTVKPRNVVTGMSLDRADFEESEGEDVLAPVVWDDQGADDVGEEVREQVLGHGAVCSGQRHGSCVLVVLFVETCIHGWRVEPTVDVKEADLGAEHCRHAKSERKEDGFGLAVQRNSAESWQMKDSPSKRTVATVLSGPGSWSDEVGVGIVQAPTSMSGVATTTRLRSAPSAMLAYSVPLTRTNGCTLYLYSHLGLPVRSARA